jgi:hypothetical protein
MVSWKAWWQMLEGPGSAAAHGVPLGSGTTTITELPSVEEIDALETLKKWKDKLPSVNRTDRTRFRS